MLTTIIKNAKIVNEGNIIEADVLIKNSRIEKIAKNISEKFAATEIDANGKHLIPGIIDDQVHFREPGLTHKAEIYTEAKAAVAGGTTTFMEQPNTKPQTLTQELLEEKYQIAQRKSLANFSFFMGASNDNIEEVKKTNPKNVCGIKMFMGSSTGNMLVDNEVILEKVFADAPCIIATHCESEKVIRQNLEEAERRFGKDIPVEWHPIIRNEKACYESSSLAISLAKKHGAKLNVFHISTADEIPLFAANTTVNKNSTTAEVLAALASKKITAEQCVHHLYFSADDYKTLGNQIKCNPAIKDAHHKAALLEALLCNQTDLIATDHAPHTWEEKQQTQYSQAPAGLPLVQHSLQMLLSFYHEGKISLEKIVEKMCHAPAVIFQIENRGFIREGYFADLALVDINQDFTVKKENIFYKCGWSPLENKTLKGAVTHTFVNGHLAYENGKFDECQNGMRLTFSR